MFRKPPTNLSELKIPRHYKVYHVKSHYDFGTNKQAAENFKKRNKGKYLIIVTK